MAGWYGMRDATAIVKRPQNDTSSSMRSHRTAVVTGAARIGEQSQ